MHGVAGLLAGLQSSAHVKSTTTLRDVTNCLGRAVTPPSYNAHRYRRLQRMAAHASTVLELTKPDDWHLHVRDGTAMQSVVPHTAAHYQRAIIMPNLVPPVTTTQQVRHARHLDHLRHTLVSTGARLQSAHPRCPASYHTLYTPHDALPDRQHPTIRGLCRQGCWHPRFQALPGWSHYQLRLGRD